MQINMQPNVMHSPNWLKRVFNPDQHPMNVVFEHFTKHAKKNTKYVGIEKYGKRLKKLIAANQKPTDVPDKNRGDFKQFVVEMRAALQKMDAVYETVNQFASDAKSTYWVRKKAESGVLAVLNDHLSRFFGNRPEDMHRYYGLEDAGLKFETTQPIFDSYHIAGNFIHEMEL